MMADAHEQYASDYDTSSVVKNLFTASASSARRDPCQVATKGFRAETHATSGPIVNTSCPGKKHEHEQNIVRDSSIKTQLLHTSKQTRMMTGRQKFPSNHQQHQTPGHESRLPSTSPPLLIHQSNSRANYSRR